MGLLTPLGHGLKTNWEKLVAGVSGIRKITSFDTTNYTSKIAGQIPFGTGADEVNLDTLISPKEQRRNDPFVQYGIIAGSDALSDSGYAPKTEEEAERSGILMGSGIGGLQTIESGTLSIEKENGPQRLSPFFIPSAIINLIGGQLAIKYHFKGPNTTVSTACATGTHAIGDAVRIIRNDEADVMIAGGAEAAICPCGVGGFCQARAMSTHYNDTPAMGSRPWDADRDGFVMGEGSGAVVLEEYNHAKARGAKIYAEVVGYAATCDAYHVTAPGAGGLRAMQLALKSADLNPEDIDYINAHGTSTPVGDMVEFNAVKTLFGGTNVAMSSTKSCTGHLLGAAGAVEAIYSILALQTGVIPPTINLDHPEEDTKGFNLVPHTAQERPVRIALSNSFGFGGTNGTVIFKKV